MPTKRLTETDPLKRFRRVFDMIERPKGGLPTMPTKVSNLASEELGDMMARYTSWREFTEDCHADACAVYAQVKSQYDLASDRALLQMDGGTVTEKRAAVKNNPEVASLYKKLTEDERITLYGTGLENKIPLFSFAVKGAHHEDLALIMDKMGIALRSGQMCAEPLMDRLGVTGLLRASFAPYNTMDEARYFIECLDKAVNMLV